MQIQLKVQGLGHVPSFKNSKMLTRGKLITDPKKQQFMDRVIRSFASQLFSLSQTIGPGTPTGHSPRCLIASSLPEDDSVKFISEETVSVQFVEKGMEGAIVKIEEVV